MKRKNIEKKLLALRIRLTTCWLLTNRVLKMFVLSFFLFLFLTFCRRQRFLYINLLVLSVHFFLIYLAYHQTCVKAPPRPCLDFTNKAECQIPNNFVLDQS